MSKKINCIKCGEPFELFRLIKHKCDVEHKCGFYCSKCYEKNIYPLK